MSFSSLVPSSQKAAYMIASGVICLIYVLCAIVLFFGVREQKGKASICQSNWHYYSLLELSHFVLHQKPKLM